MSTDLGPRPSVLLLSTDDCDLVAALVGALDCEHPDVADPQSTIGRANTATARVAVFIEALYLSGKPAPWKWSDGGVVYDSPATYRILGVVSIHPQRPGNT